MWALGLGFAIMALLVPTTLNVERVGLACPPGTHERGEPDGITFHCVDSDGLRHGPFAVLGANGEHLISGEFRDDREHGIWVMPDLLSANPETTYAVWRDGRDITEKLASRLPRNCRAWRKLDAVTKAGLCAVIAFSATDALTSPAGIGPARCIAQHAPEIAAGVDDECASRDPEPLFAIGRQLAAVTAECDGND